MAAYDANPGRALIVTDFTPGSMGIASGGYRMRHTAWAEQIRYRRPLFALEGSKKYGSRQEALARRAVRASIGEPATAALEIPYELRASAATELGLHVTDEVMREFNVAEHLDWLAILFGKTVFLDELNRQREQADRSIGAPEE